MSQPPSKPHGKPGPGGDWSARPNVSGHYRPPSPYSPSSSPHPLRPRGPPTPVHHAHPTSPLTYFGMMHPMSPVPIGMPISPGISPVAGSPSYIQCPRPRWPSPLPASSQAPRPFIPTQSSAESGTSSPLACGPLEYMIGPYRSGEYEYVGVPLDHSQTEEESSGPSTAEIIANQSQDYVDEKLAEYQATIQQLQNEQERVQKKTFVNWINSYLSKRIPPLRVDDLIDDLKDGTRLLALLEVLSGEKLPVEKGRNLKRPHFLSNANTALQFLRSKKIKLVNINSSDLVDGRPPVVLGLIWTIILYFQIEENTRALEYLGHTWGSQSSLESLSTQGSASGEKKRIVSEKWKQGARKTLLQWVTNALPKDIKVRDFGESWRDGNAFLAIIDAIKANLVNIAAMREATNRARLATAFHVAESELGIARLLDPEDVDVPQPDEKSIMTYVAQFLHKYPQSGSTASDSFAGVRQEYDGLYNWLNEKVKYLEELDKTNSYPLSYRDYDILKAEADQQVVIYNKLQRLVEAPSTISITRDSWKQIQNLWNTFEILMLHWLSFLDSSLPGDLAEIGKWLGCAEALLISDNDIPEEMTKETADIIWNKLADHKKFFRDLPDMEMRFLAAERSELTANVQPAILNRMKARLDSLPDRAARRRTRLNFLYHKCCLIAFLFVFESRLKEWSVEYGTEEKVHQMLEQYRNNVSKKRLFQVFQKAYLTTQRIAEEYKAEGYADEEEIANIDRFMRETSGKWKSVSMDLRCLQSMLEEVVAYWRRWSVVSDEFEAWLNQAEPALNLPEEEKMEFFQDISVWKDKHQQLSDTVTFLIATSDEPVALQLKQRFSNITSRWESLFQEAKQYMRAGDVIRNRKDYRAGVETLQNWLRNVESALSATDLTTTEKIKAYGEKLQVFHNEVEGIEDLFKNISKKFQTLIQDLSRDEVDKMMNTLKKEKEALVKVRALIPMQLHLYHQLLVQQESLEAGQKEISAWLDEAERMLSSIDLSGDKEYILAQLDRHKAFFSRTLYYKSMLESKNKVFTSIVKSVDSHADVNTAEGGKTLRELNDRFNKVSQAAQNWEQRLQEAVRCWTKFKECERQVSEWLTVAETMINDKHTDNRRSIEYHKNFFSNVSEKWIQDFVNAGQDLKNVLPVEQQAPIVEAVEALQRRWKEVLTFAPLHLMRLEFRLDEATFLQYLKGIEVEINSEQQALMKNENVETILQRNKEFFVSRGTVVEVEKCLQTLKKISNAYTQLKPSDTSLAEATQNAERLWVESSQKVERLKEQLKQVPQQWAAYKKKFDEMVRWMDHVDSNLRTILHEVNTLEEFETEKTIFQKICREADSKREEMKWLVQTLDSLTSDRSDHEAVSEQNRLEQLITRYKNLIPTIEITMTKTDIYSKSYTYRKEVREVCTLLHKVRDQSKVDVVAEGPETLHTAVSHQESRLSHLEQQRPNIVSMLQRGKDLLKDQHAPPFVSLEVQQLESSWNDTYGQSVETLKSLKNTQKLWNTYVEQKEEILKLIEQADEELRKIEKTTYYDASQVSSDLQNKQDFSSTLRKSAEELMKKLQETYSHLTEMTPPERREVLKKEITITEKRMETTLKTVQEKVVHLQEHSTRWNKFQAKLNELQMWSQQLAPQSIADTENLATTPEEMVYRTETLQKEILERTKTLKFLEEESRKLVKDDGGSPQGKQLRDDIKGLEKTIETLQKSIVTQRQTASQNLETWKEYEKGIRELKPWIEESEAKAATIGSKPTTLAQAAQMLETVKAFEVRCQKHFPKIQDLSLISQRISGKTSASDEVDAVRTRWNAVHDTAVQTTTKLDKLVTSWTSFESEIKEFKEWLERSERTVLVEPNTQTPEVSVLEKELARLKDFNKTISDHQAQLISLTQVSDHISHGLSLEGASNLKSRVSDIKSRVSKLADTVRLQINKVSDTLLARQEFQMKITDFENWMSRLRSNIAEISDATVDTVDTNLQAVHAYIQEHSEKQPSFAVIYNEVKQLSSKGSAMEAAALDETYTTLAKKYKTLEDDLLQKKKGLEKWIEMLSWLNDANAQLSHCKYEAEARKPTIADLERFSSELQTIYDKIESWKKHVLPDAAVGIQIRDKQGKPLSASGLLNDLENKAMALKNEISSKRDRLESLDARWNNFRSLQQSITEKILNTQTTLQDIVYNVDTCNQLAPAVDKIDRLIEEHQKREQEKEILHFEGSTLMKEDQRSTTNIQVVLSSVDANWEKVNELLREQRKKYADMGADWEEYKEAKQKLKKSVEKANNMCRSLTGVPCNISQANLILEKHKKALEAVKKGKQFLDKMDSKAQQLMKETSLMPRFNSDLIEKDLTESRQKYQETYNDISEQLQAYETQVIIWKQIEESKSELTKWLTNTNNALTTAFERLLDAENCQARLIRYREELPTYQQLYRNIVSKIEQLAKLNNDSDIPTLSSLHKLLDDQFNLVKSSADKLESLTSTLNERERTIRQEMKRCGDLISKIREEIIKCDDLTGENTKILGRINKCQELKTELEQCDYALSKVDETLTTISSEYPSISRSSLPKELQALQLRRDGVASHANKVIATLVAFLTKLYHEKFGALQRMVVMLKEKVAWCEPEQSSDRYNLEVKMASLMDVEAGIADCTARKKDTDSSLKLLSSVESAETMAALKADRDKVEVDLESLKSSYAKIKNDLERNIALWQRYELTSDSVLSWLKENENKIRAEASALINPDDIEDKIAEITQVQKTVMEYSKELKALTALAEDITKVSSESRVNQYIVHLNTRYDYVLKFLSQHLDRLKELKDNRDQYLTNRKKLEVWLNDAEKTLKVFDEITGPKPITFYQSRLKELKAFAEEREVGQAILNKTAEAGEALFARITPDQREAIRAELRNFRNRVDAMADRANAIYKKIESDMMHRSSFEDKFSQVKQWLVDAQNKLGEKQELLPTLQEKKLALHLYRTVAQDVTVHKNILQQLQERLSSAPDDEASEMLDSVVEAYEKLSNEVEGRINIAEKHVSNHEAYLQTFEKTRDWINTVINEGTPIIEDFSVERDTAQAKIASIENLLQQKAEGDRILTDCNQQLNIVLEQTSMPGHPALISNFEQQKKMWQDFLKKCITARDKLKHMFSQWSEFEKIVEGLEAWIKQMETQLKDQSLKSTEEAKRAHLQRLKSLEETIIAKESEFNTAIEKSQSIEAEADLATRVSRQTTKYQAIKNQIKEAVMRYEQFVKEHNTFNVKYEQLMQWITDIQSELKKHSEIVGNLSVLQSRQKLIRDLGDTRTKENARFESVIDLGEKLYVHTSPDGREIIRQQLRNLRTLWDGFSEELQNTTQKLDQCLMQFAEFSLSHEQLTAWLRDVERAMHQHTELKCTLEEKRAQLQNHKIMHQEIMSHQSLVESVCDKAQQLVDQTKDTSLNVFLPSIKQLFHNIVAKSKDLLENLEDCVEKHHGFNLQVKNFSDWLNGEREKLAECNDVTGERADISRRLATLAALKDDQRQGANFLEKLKELSESVITRTAPKGWDAINKEITVLEGNLRQYLSETETVEEKQKAALQKWQDFEDKLEAHTKWFSTMEAAFRDQQLQPTLQDKEARLQILKEKRDAILKEESKIDEFVDKSHSLLHASGVERIKPLISQISNRYQQLHVLSKEVVTRCQSIVDDHRAYEEKLKAVDTWLTQLEQSLAGLKRDEASGNMEERVSRLQILLAEKEQGEHRLGSLTSFGERILADTSAQGRELIRHELRQARERWDMLLEGIVEQQKKQDAQSLQWSNYQETLQQILAWLDTMERSVKQDSSITWSSLQEIKSKLLKSKGVHQEILAYKRIIEGVSEKANALSYTAQVPSDAQQKAASVSGRYEDLVEMSQKNISNLETLLDTFQQFYDLQKSYQDYQKQQWEQLNNYSDYNSGNKAALQAQLTKIMELQDGQREGELKLNILSEHVAHSAHNLSPRSLESMERDLATLRFEQKKFATAVNDIIRCIEERIQQWSEYENSLERLLAWLTDAESSLKNYSLKNTLDEKQEQLEKYQALQKTALSWDTEVTELVALGDHLDQMLIVNLRQNEAEFDKMSDESSELMQISGETRFSASVQQITSRFQSIQATAKELVKKCEQAVADHAAYLERYKQCSEWLADTRSTYQSIKEDLNGSRQELSSNVATLKDLLARQSSATLLINNTVEAGERLYPTTGMEGREIVRQQLLDLQQAFEELYDNVASTERELQSKISRWSGFDDSSDAFEKWLSTIEAQLKPEIELKTTLDEKRAQLQIYRTFLHDIQSHQQDLLDLRDKADNLPDSTDKVHQTLRKLSERHATVLKRAAAFVERYEGIVSDHQQYSKAVLDTHEWLDATHNAVILWGDTELERVSLHTNLDRLKNLLQSLPEDKPSVQQIRTLGEKVIPGTLESGQINIRSQIDSSQQEWESLVTAVKSTIESLENKLQQWNEFEASKERCLAWMRETDTKLHAVDLKPTLQEKKEQLEFLRTLQGQVRAKELEIDAVTEKAQQLHKNITSRTTHMSELSIKYQQISNKVKDLNSRWHQYVTTHQEFDNQMAECTRWLDDIRGKLAYCSDMDASSQKDLKNKMEIVQDLLLYKEDGFAKVQGIVGLAQTVLANTAPSGHKAINDAVGKLQEQWSALVSKTMETKMNLNDSINKWAGLLEQIQSMNKNVDYMQSALDELTPFQTSMSEKRCQLERIKALEEKVRCENIEVDSLKIKVAEMIASGPQGLAASQAQSILDRFDTLFEKIKSLLAEREEQYKDHRLYKEAHDDIINWLSRAREKIPSMKQRSLTDKLAIENAVAPLESLLNKKAQGELLVEHLQHTGNVASASTSPEGQEIIKNEVRALAQSFEELFREIKQQKDQLEQTVSQWRDYKDEYERLSDWLQQFDILIKAQKNSLLPNVAEKEKQVQEVKEILENLLKGQEQIDKFNKAASGLLSSHLDTYINNQLRHLNSRYQVQVNLAKDVLNKVEGNLAQHKEYEANLAKTRAWIENAKQIIRKGTEAASTSSREELQNRLDNIQELLRKREEGQNLVHLTVNCGEKVMRNTRSDGREEINAQLKEIQNDWERLVKKISTTKVHLETSLLQWADYSSSYLQLQQWINDREAKLQQVCEQKVSKARKGLAGLSSLAIGERKANLRQTNSIVQDIVAFEPMIQSVTTKAEDLRQATPATEISIKYETLSKQAQELYAKQKETVEQHQAFIDSGNEFIQWIRAAKERLGKCSEPTGDKESLVNKITQLKVLQSELPEGQKKLQHALEQGNAACQIADEEDKEIIEEEVALLQEEYDSYVDSLNHTKSLLEVGIAKWTEYEDQFSEATEWFTKTEQLMQTYNILQDSLKDKENVVREFQKHLQSLFDWQKELDCLNMKAQMLLETCADTRISNAITQLTTKYNAFLSLAKEIMRRLELHYQEHQQHNTLYQECRVLIERALHNLEKCKTIPGSLEQVNKNLDTCKAIRQTLEQGQNKLRYALELKERVIMNTKQHGAAQIQEDTEELKTKFEELLVNVEDIRQKLSARATVLEELNKIDRLTTDWIEELKGNTESSIIWLRLRGMTKPYNVVTVYKNDLSEKRAILEKYKTVQRDIEGHGGIVDRLRARLAEDTNIPHSSTNILTKYDELKKILVEEIRNLEEQVSNHEKFQQAYNEAADWVRQTKIELQQNCDTHGEKDRIIERENKVNQIIASLPKGETLIAKVIQLSDDVIATTGPEGQQTIKQDVKQLQANWKSLQAQCHESQKTLSNCISSWSQFTAALDSMKRWIDHFQKKVNDEQSKENKTPEDLVRCKSLVEEAIQQKPVLEDLNDKCEALLEMSACSWARDKTVQLQSAYTSLLTDMQGVVSRVEKNLSDHTEFLKAKKEMEGWLRIARGSVQDCMGVGDAEWAKDKLETIKIVATRITEGQHLLSTLQDAFTKAIDTAVPEEQDQLRSDMTGLLSSWEQLSLDLNTVQAQLKSLLTRWDDHNEAHGKMKRWLEETERSIEELPDTKGEFGNMKTLLERYKHIQEEVRGKKSELDHLMEEAEELSKLAKKNTPLEQTRGLLKRWQSLSDTVDEGKKLIENEMQEYNAYHAALQETEKWLLQISFQLMAHNSLYITNKEQTVSQIQQHENLLVDIENYTSVLDDLKLKGSGQITRYVAANPEIKTTIETQLQNVQESYNSLLNTALQIKKRLAESLVKFQEYENTLESIMKNLDAYEPEINQEMEAPIETLDMAKQRFETARTLHNKLQGEKTRLALAVEACEAAVACVSRPGSPLDAPAVQIPAREVEVRNKLEELIDQAQGHLMNVTKTLNELEEQTRQKNALRAWINQQRALCAEWKSRPAKLRSEAAHAELQAMNDLLGNVGERRTHAIAELSIHEDDHDIEEGLNKLETELTEAIAGKQAAQDLIQKYRTQVQNVQSWLDALSKKVDVIEKGNGQTIGQKIASVKEITAEFESHGPGKLDEVKSLGDQVMDSVSNLDSQQIEEQIKSVERRYADIAKKLQRKAQVLDMTAQGIEATRQEIEENREWIQDKKKQAQLSEPVGYDSKQADERLLALKAMLKEAEGKQMVIDTLEKRVGNMQNELESNEQQQLENETKALRGEQAQLCTILTEGISSATAAADIRRKFEGDLERARAWIKSKSNNLKKLSGYLPLKAAKVEQDIVQHNELESDIESFSEKDLNDILKHGHNLLKECNEEDRAKLESVLDELSGDYEDLKDEAKVKQAALADLLQGRKAFENEIDKCQRWINEADVATSSDLRTSSIDILREQLAKYDRLKKEAKEYADDIEKIIQQGKSILPTVSDADKLELSEQLQNMKEAHGRVAGIINERAAALQKSIDEAEESLARVAEAVQYMTDVQKELHELNKPIGSRVEDIEAMLDAYEKILNDLKENKAKLSDLQSVNVGDLHGVLTQQDDLIKAIESQIAKLRQLLLLRQQFIALITEISTFIAKYTEIVRDIENSGLTIEEKIKRYDDAILKIQECEATLASATDKGQQIAAEGTTADRNNITEQLQSLKQQLQGLRRAVETQREQHELAAVEHKRLANELAEILDWLEDKEKEVKSRPLLERDPTSVEAELKKHNELCEAVNEHLDRIRNLKNSVPYEEGMPGSLKEMLSEAVSLLTSLPREMEERGNYLESNMKLRQEYAALTDKLRCWVREAEIRLESDKDGLDFENILTDLEEHKIYFSSESSIRELVSQQIQQAADKIWPSLNTSEQEELSAEQQQHTQLLKNTLNTAKSHRARLEQGAETWRDYTQTLDRVRAVIARTKFTDEPVTTLAGLQFNIQKITHALNDIQNQQFELDLLNERSREVLRLADENNKKNIESQVSEINTEWKDLVSGLEGRRDALEALSKHWEDLEAQWSLIETRLNATEEKSKLLDTVIRSKQSLLDAIKAQNELVAEAEKLKPMTDEVKDLTRPVLAYLAAFTEAAAHALEEKLNKLQNSVESLIDSLQKKSKKADEDFEAFESAEREIEQLRKRLNEARERASNLYVFGPDQDAAEEELEELSSKVGELLDDAKKFSGSTKARYQASQQLVPSDLAQHLTGLELCAEATAQVMEEKQREQKRARTVRSDYLTDLDEVQAWIRQAELKVQDRSIEPIPLKEQLKQVQDELGTISDKLERLTRNGRTIAENTRDETEKQLIDSTVHNVTEQLNQVRTWLDDRKQVVADTLDAWQRFLTLYEAVKAWTAEKKQFLVEPLELSTLVQARQRLHEYSTAVKSCKQINKNLSDMGKELESIGQVCSVGDLPEKLLEAEEAKVQVEGQLLERNALLQETSEEWEQYERKLKEARTWIEKAKQSLESAQNKKKPLRDQHSIREKMLSDVAIQKKKIILSMQKLQIHFRSGIGGDSRISERADELLAELDSLNSTVKEQATSLEACLAQIDQYQQEIQQLRQQIMQVEQQLRTVLSPTYLSTDKEKALQEQQICREKIKSLQSKIQARTEKSKILAQRGTPDPEPLDP